MTRVISYYIGDVKHEYVCKYDWPEHVHIQVDCENKVDRVIIYHFEIYFDDYWINNNASSLQTPSKLNRNEYIKALEKNVFLKWQETLNCDHYQFTKLDVYGGGEVCTMCLIYKVKANELNNNKMS